MHASTGLALAVLLVGAPIGIPCSTLLTASLLIFLLSSYKLGKCFYIQWIKCSAPNLSAGYAFLRRDHTQSFVPSSTLTAHSLEPHPQQFGRQAVSALATVQSAAPPGDEGRPKTPSAAEPAASYVATFARFMWLLNTSVMHMPICTNITIQPFWYMAKSPNCQGVVQ